MYRVFGEYVVPWVQGYGGNRGIRCTLYVVNHGIDGGIRSVPCIRGNYEYVVPWVP